MTTFTIDRLRALRLRSEAVAALRSLGWMGVGQVLILILRLGSSLILTRLLAPEAYGIIGTALTITTTLEWFSDIGVIGGIVRHPRGGEPSFVMTGWTLGVGRGLVIGLVTLTLAYPVAWFNSQPELVGVLALLAVRPILQSLRSPGILLFKRKLEYGRYVIDEVSMVGVTIAVSVAVAYATRSTWALVIGSVAGTAFEVALTYILWPIRPRWLFDKEAVRELSHFGRQALVNTLLMSLWLNFNGLIGLKFVSVDAMGLFFIALNLAGAAEGFITRGLDVYFAVLSRRSGDERRSALHAKALDRIVPLAMPFGALAVLAAPFVVRLIYDPRYAGAGPIFATLTARLLIYALGLLQFQELAVRARMTLTSMAYAVAVVVQATAFFALVPQLGALGLAFASLGSAAAFTATQSVLVARDGRPSWRALGLTFGWVAVGLAGMGLLERAFSS